MIAGGALLMLRLQVGWPNMMLLRRLQLVGVGLGVDAAVAAVEAGAGDVGVARDVDVVDDGLIVDVGDMRAAEIVHGLVVVEMVVIPETAEIAGADIAEAVIDAAIEADMRAPITAMPEIGAVNPAPIAGCP